jgi:hypothetical protein
MKITDIRKLKFVGDDFTGEYEEGKLLGSNRLAVSLGCEGKFCTQNGVTVEQPGASFSAFTDENEIDRLAAAAKIAWRMINKR